MLSLAARRPLNQWEDQQSIRPGPVGSVGDALVAVQLKSSLPGDYREASYTKGKKELRYGSNVQNGDVPSWNTKGMQARTYDGFFGGERDSMTTQRGWIFQNITAEDMFHEPIVGSLPQYAWRNQKATINGAASTGEKFKVLPGGYAPGPFDVPRGGSKPGVVNGDLAAPQILAGGAKAYQPALQPQIDYGGVQDLWTGRSRLEEARRGLMGRNAQRQGALGIR